jgi:DNA-binding NarL/FixJ family response regulator
MEIELEKVLAPRRARIFQIGPDRVGWIGLRTTLGGLGYVRIVGDVASGGEAVQQARTCHPDAFLVAADLPDEPVDALVPRLHACSPASKIVVVGDEPDHDVLAALVQAGMHGYLVWRELTPVQVHRCLAGVLEADLWIGSRAAVEALSQPPEGEARGENEEGLFTQRERAVLKGLEEDLPRNEIARRAGMSERTVDRTIQNLESKLEVTNRYALGNKVGKLRPDL